MPPNASSNRRPATSHDKPVSPATTLAWLCRIYHFNARNLADTSRWSTGRLGLHMIFLLSRSSDLVFAEIMHRGIDHWQIHLSIITAIFQELQCLGKWYNLWLCIRYFLCSLINFTWNFLYRLPNVYFTFKVLSFVSIILIDCEDCFEISPKNDWFNICWSFYNYVFMYHFC